jgi:hypothetical protein
MRIYRIVCLSAAFLLPQLAVAKLPLPENSLGKLEGILDFCAQVEPQEASKFEAHKKSLFGDASDEEIADARRSRDYDEGHNEISDKLAKVPNDKAVRACSAYLNGGN